MNETVKGYMRLNGISIPIEFELELPGREPEIFRTEFAEVLTRLQRLENRVTNHMGSEMKMELGGITELIQAIQFGQKIQVIKALRTATPGLGLKEAKELVESAWNSYLAEQANTAREPQF